MSSAKAIVAKAIKKADSSWFNEDYNKQADAVIKALASNGMMVVPVIPDDRIVEAGKNAMSAGRHRPSDVIKTIYSATVRAAGSKA